MTTNPASTHPPLGEAAEAAAPAAFAVPESDWNAAVNLLSGASEAYLVCHVSPDGDALGSALAAGLGLRAIGIRTHVSVGEDPLVVPCSLDFLPGQELLIPAAAVPTAPELMVAFDAPSFDRLGLLKPGGRSAAGYRLYGERDFARLQQVLTLKFIGLPLKQIKELLGRKEFDLAGVLRLQREVLEAHFDLALHVNKGMGARRAESHTGKTMRKFAIRFAEHHPRAEEVRKRDTPDALVPIDRDPVPPEFVDGVRRYYERLGSGR